MFSPPLASLRGLDVAADGYQYTQFCRHYHAWADHLDPVLRQQHTAGERTFVDYAGQTIEVVEPTTGEVRDDTTSQNITGWIREIASANRLCTSASVVVGSLL